MKLKLALGAAVTVLLLGAAGLLAYGFVFSPAADGAAKLVPKDALMYAHVFIEPSNNQKQAIESLLQETPFESFEGLKERIVESAEESLEGSGCTFEEDVEPFLPEEVAFFATDPEAFGAVLDVADPAGMFDSLERCGDLEMSEEKSYKGVDYNLSEDDAAYGVVEGLVVGGTEATFKAVVDTSQGEGSIEDSEEFQAALGRHPAERIAFLYGDLGMLFGELARSGEIPPEETGVLKSLYGPGGATSFSAALSVRADALVLEYAAPTPKEGAAKELADSYGAVAETDIVASLPEGSWGSFGIGSVGRYVDAILDTFGQFGIPGFSRAALEQRFEKETGLDLQEDVLSWMGDAGLFIQGTSPLTFSGGLVLETSDKGKTAEVLDRVAELASDEGAPVKPLTIPGVEGFAIQDPTMPQPVNIALGEDRLVVAYGNLATELALEENVTLAESDTFARATDTLGDDFSVNAYVDMNQLIDVIETAVASARTVDPVTGDVIPDPTAREDFDTKVKPYLEPLSYAVMGGRLDDEASIVRIAVGAD